MSLPEVNQLTFIIQHFLPLLLVSLCSFTFAFELSILWKKCPFSLNLLPFGIQVILSVGTFITSFLPSLRNDEACFIRLNPVYDMTRHGMAILASFWGFLSLWLISSKNMSKLSNSIRIIPYLMSLLELGAIIWYISLFSYSSSHVVFISDYCLSIVYQSLVLKRLEVALWLLFSFRLVTLLVWTIDVVKGVRCRDREVLCCALCMVLLLSSLPISTWLFRSSPNWIAPLQCITCVTVLIPLKILIFPDVKIEKNNTPVIIPLNNSPKSELFPSLEVSLPTSSLSSLSFSSSNTSASVNTVFHWPLGLNNLWSNKSSASSKTFQ